MPKDAKKKAKPVEEEEDLELEEEEEEESDEPEGEDEEVESEDGDEDEGEDEEPKKGKKGKAKTGRGSGLVPREPVSVPKTVFKAQSKDVQKLLVAREKAQAAGDKKELRKIRSALRKAGFRLSKIGEAAED